MSQYMRLSPLSCRHRSARVVDGTRHNHPRLLNICACPPLSCRHRSARVVDGTRHNHPRLLNICACPLYRVRSHRTCPPERKRDSFSRTRSLAGLDALCRSLYRKLQLTWLSKQFRVLKNVGYFKRPIDEVLGHDPRWQDNRRTGITVLRKDAMKHYGIPTKECSS